MESDVVYIGNVDNKDILEMHKYIVCLCLFCTW